MKTGLGASLIKDIAIGGIQMHELFAAGLIYSLMQDYDLQTAADFAVANSALKATIHGDAGMIDDPQQVMAVFGKSDIKR